MITSNSISAALPGPDRVKTQQVMAINCRGIFSVSRRPPGGRSGAIGMPLSASVRLLEGGKSGKTGLRPSSSEPIWVSHTLTASLWGLQITRQAGMSISRGLQAEASCTFLSR